MGSHGTERLEDDDRDLPGRLLLIFGVGRVEADHHRPEAVALLALRVVRTNVNVLPADLEIGFARAKVQIPGGVLRVASLRGDHDVAIAVAPVEERHRALLARLAA